MIINISSRLNWWRRGGVWYPFSSNLYSQYNSPETELLWAQGYDCCTVCLGLSNIGLFPPALIKQLSIGQNPFLER